MKSVRDIIEAFRALPRADRVRLVEQLREELGLEPLRGRAVAQADDSRFVSQDGHVFTGPVDSAELDHRIDREEHLARLAALDGNGVETAVRDRKR